jgi:hypothetical protein
VLSEWRAKKAIATQEAVSTTLQETLTKLQSAHLATVAAVPWNVVGWIDALLFERQLVKFGFDAVAPSDYKGRNEAS